MEKAMQFTSAQQTTFKTWLTANASGLSDQAAADLANALVSPNYFVWQTSVQKSVLDAQINKANYTPSDSVPPSGATVQITNDALLYNNRALICQLKQTNAQWLTGGDPGSGIDCRVVQVRQNFKDCLLAIPAGASGASADAGWGTIVAPGTVRTAMMRACTNLEKLFVTASSGPGSDGVSGNRGTNTNPDILGVGTNGSTLEGTVTPGQVAEVRASA
jgi:hypothetical protein